LKRGTSHSPPKPQVASLKTTEKSFKEKRRDTQPRDDSEAKIPRKKKQKGLREGAKQEQIPEQFQYESGEGKERLKYCHWGYKKRVQVKRGNFTGRDREISLTSSKGRKSARTHRERQRNQGGDWCIK